MTTQHFTAPTTKIEDLHDVLDCLNSLHAASLSLSPDYLFLPVLKSLAVHLSSILSVTNTAH